MYIHINVDNHILIRVIIRIRIYDVCVYVGMRIIYNSLSNTIKNNNICAYILIITYAYHVMFKPLNHSIIHNFKHDKYI